MAVDNLVDGDGGRALMDRDIHIFEISPIRMVCSNSHGRGNVR